MCDMDVTTDRNAEACDDDHSNDDEWIAQAVRTLEYNDRAYYYGRSQAWWLGEYRRAGVA